MKIAILSSYTLNFLPKAVEKLLFDIKKIQWYVANFNQFRQEILDKNSMSRDFNPDIVLISITVEDFLIDTDGVFNVLNMASEAYPTAVILIHNIVLLRPEPLRLFNYDSSSS